MSTADDLLDPQSPLAQSPIAETPTVVSPAVRPARVESLEFDFGGGTHVGLKRTNNEDHFAIVERQRTRKILLTNIDTAGLSLPGDSAYVLIVADGIGGCGFGELASEMILRIGWDLASTAPAWFMKYEAEQFPKLREQVVAFCRQLQAELQRYARTDPQFDGMGTTWTCLYLMGPDALLGHAGDSRAYRYRRGVLQQLTRDHTYAQKLLDKGVPTAEAMRYKNTLINAFGAHSDGVEIDVEHVDLEPGDRLLLCSDGLSDMVHDAQIAALLATVEGPQTACDALIDLALKNGGRDNVTVLIADVSAQVPPNPALEIVAQSV